MLRTEAALTVSLGVLTVAHDLDHIRQGRSLPGVLYLVAFGALASIAATLFVLVRFPQHARPTAIALGVITVVGVGAVHAAPQWSSYTDSYAAADADAISWAIIVGMMGFGAALAVVTAVAARSRA